MNEGEIKDNQRPPNLKIWQLVLGFANTNIIYTLAKLNVFEQLRENPKTLQQLSKDLKLNKEVLFRTLRFAIMLNAVSLNKDRYLLTESGKYLLRNVPGSIYELLMLIGSNTWQKNWGNLSYALKTGESVFDKEMDCSFFEYLNNNLEEGEHFNCWMNDISKMFSSTFIKSYDFSKFRTICDIGGGQGILLKEILLSNNNLKGILYDQESVLKNHSLSEFGNRAVIKSGNFFEEIPNADLLILKSIIHDWDDNNAVKILKVCKGVMNSKTKMILIEMVIDKKPDFIECYYDIGMQIMFGSKERSANDFKLLLNKAGLKLNQIINTNSPFKIIEVSL